MLADILKVVKQRYFDIKYKTTNDPDYLTARYDSDQAECDILVALFVNVILGIYLFNYRYYNAFGFVVHYATMFALLKMLGKICFSPRTIYQLIMYAITDVILVSLSVLPLLIFAMWIEL